jgi:hypothetical protein
MRVAPYSRILYNMPLTYRLYRFLRLCQESGTALLRFEYCLRDSRT